MENQVGTVVLRVEYCNKEWLRVVYNDGEVREVVFSTNTFNTQLILMRITESIFDVDFYKALITPPTSDNKLGVYEFRATTKTAEEFLKYVDNVTKQK